MVGKIAVQVYAPERRFCNVIDCFYLFYKLGNLFCFPFNIAPTGAPGTPGTEAAASFFSDLREVPSGTPIPLYPLTPDPTGAITPAPDYLSLLLQPGFYLVTFDVAAVLLQPGYLQVTPAVGGVPQVNLGVYFRTAVGDSSAGGSRTFLFNAPAATTFSLTYSASAPTTSVTTTLTVQKLNRAE